MEKIIGKKRYSTETAAHIGTGYSDYPKNDFHYWEEELYRKRTGEYFLYGWGNAASRYSKAVGQNEWCGSEKIQPLSDEAARRWAEEHLEAEDYTKYFEVDPEDADILRQSVSMPTKLNDFLRAEAETRKVPISTIVTEALEDYRDKHSESQNSSEP